MKKCLFVWSLVTMLVVYSYAEEEATELRKEFEAYKQASEARLASLEEQAAKFSVSAEQEDAASGFAFHGYFRAGLGANGDGDPMEAFKAPNAGAKYRLGNEAEAYVEATFKQGFPSAAQTKNGVDFYTQLTFAYVTPSVDNNAFDTTTSLREAYAGARGVWKAQHEAMFWAGNRYYEQHDIHMNDFFFRDMAGFGGGIEDVVVGDEMKWAFAWLGGSIDELDSDGTTYDNDYNFNKNTFDLRLYDIRMGNSTLALSLSAADFSGDTLVSGGATVIIDDSMGWATGAILASDLTDRLANRFSMQYGEGAADNFRAVITAPQGVDLTTVSRVPVDEARRFRVTDDVVIETGPPVSLQAVAIYERYDNGYDTMNTIDWVSLGLRPVWHFNDYFSLAFEAGADYTHQKDGLEGALGKFTFAPQIQPEATFFGRPSIRAFVTYAAWTGGFEGSVASVGYANQRQGVTAGVQMEAWW